MTLLVKNFIEHLDSFHGRELETVFQKKRFTLLFHDCVKLRFRLESRDISVPLSILLIGINLLLTKKEFSKSLCVKLLGKEWGFPHVARMLLECEDVCLKQNVKEFTLVRIRLQKNNHAPVKRRPIETCARRSG